jgi:hypothetical protein
MDTKLTLKLDQDIIEKAKGYAKSRKTSVSRLIENFLQKLTSEDQEDKKEEITPLVKSLSGIINLPSDYDHKKDYADHLSKKYR